jgi:hypothetical protein
MPARALGFASGLTVPGNINLTQFVGSMVSNITAANSAILGLRANITAANSAITTANVEMKTYVDTQVASAVIQASGYGNSVVAVYLPIDSTITSIQANVTGVNVNIATLTTNAASQSSEISGLRANITAANVGITALRANITASNVNISTLQTAAQYLSSNINGSIFSGSTYTGNVYTNNTYTGNAEVTGNLTVGNINASGNLVMTGTDSTTIRFVRSVDSTVNSGEIYGNIDFAGENSPRNAGNTRARISVTAIDSLGATDFKFYTSPFGNPGIGFFGIPATGNNPTPNFTVNGQGFYGTTAGFNQQRLSSVPAFNFEPTVNDGSILPVVTTSYFVENYNGAFYESKVGQTFTMYYVGFPGGDRANVHLGGYFPESGGGVSTLTQSDTGTTQIELAVMGTYIPDTSNPTVGIKRLRKRLIATVINVGGTYSVLDQQLCENVYNSDVTNWPAGAVNTGKVFLQANVNPGLQTLNLRFEAPTGAAVTSIMYWQWTGIFHTLNG